jgi:hypothetical protein
LRDTQLKFQSQPAAIEIPVNFSCAGAKAVGAGHLCRRFRTGGCIAYRSGVSDCIKSGRERDIPVHSAATFGFTPVGGYLCSK